MRPRLIRFSRQSNFWRPHWFLPRIKPLQERLGGRIALVAGVNVGASRLLIHKLHLESRANDERFSQIQEVLSDAARQDLQRSIVIAGDFNLDASKDSVDWAFGATGFQDAIAAPRPTTPSRRLLEPGSRIDWSFIRGPVRPKLGRVHNQIRASDHYPISFTLTASRG
jgi:endonuclease/exonuclease/phosphatase family metal-dependent hydrolase